MLAVLLLAVACGGGSGGKAATAPSPTTTPTIPPEITGTARFLLEVRAVGLGSRDVAGTSDASLINVGNVVCSGFNHGVTYVQELDVFTGAKDPATTTQAVTLVRSAVTNLCPAQLGKLP